MTDLDDSTNEYDDMTDEEVMARVDASRAALRQMEAVRGIDMMGAKNWSEEAKLAAFMGIFHPDHST